MSEANPNANVTVSCEGLAIYNFNKAANFWEFLFLRHLVNHELIVKITKHRPSDLPLEKTLTHTFRIDKGHKIFIEAENAIEPSAIQYEVEDFEFNQVNQKEDIRWMVNLSDAEVGTSSNAGCSFQGFDKRELTFMSISGKSILYTKELSKREFEIWEKVDEKTKIKLGARKLGEIIAADIECPTGETVKFRVEGLFGFTIDLPIEEGVSYEIEFNNACVTPTCQDQTDFHHYYEIFNSDRVIEFVALPMEDTEEDKETGVGACLCTSCRHLIGIDESLAELVD